MTLDRFSLCSAGYLVSNSDGPWVKHDDAQACITDLQAKLDDCVTTGEVADIVATARAEGYAAGVKDAVGWCGSILRNLGMTEGAEAIDAAASDILTLLPPENTAKRGYATGCGLDTQDGGK